eukprot:scaffold72979_cov59-Phaeocystis_antarctica.AAC.2
MVPSLSSAEEKPRSARMLLYSACDGCSCTVTSELFIVNALPSGATVSCTPALGSSAVAKASDAFASAMSR